MTSHITVICYLFEFIKVSIGLCNLFRYFIASHGHMCNFICFMSFYKKKYQICHSRLLDFISAHWNCRWFSTCSLLSPRSSFVLLAYRAATHSIFSVIIFNPVLKRTNKNSLTDCFFFFCCSNVLEKNYST